MKKVNEVIIVEGNHDLSHLKSFLNADIIVSGGTSLNQNFLDTLNAFKQAGRNFIVMTDPDSPGEYIRKEISKMIPNIKHVFVEARLSKSKNKVGIEHASKDVILKALDSAVTFSNKTNDLTALDLFDLGLTATLDSKKLRDYLVAKLNLGQSNGKTLLNRLNGLGVQKSQLAEMIEGYKKHENK